MSDWRSTPSEHFFQLCHGENKLHFDEILMISPDQSLLLLRNAACLVEKQLIPIP